MEVIAYIKDDVRDHFPTISQLAKKRVEVFAKRINANTVRWILDGPPAALGEYLKLASEHGQQCQTRGRLVKVYLATPYTGQEQTAFKHVNQIAADLMSYGLCVYSPISHGHAIAQETGVPTDWEYWRASDTEFIKWCDVVVVRCWPGWAQSKGVQAEIELAGYLGRPVVKMFPFTEVKHVLKLVAAAVDGSGRVVETTNTDMRGPE